MLLRLVIRPAFGPAFPLFFLPLILLLIQKKIKKTNPENVRRTFQNFRRFCRTLPVLLRRFGPLLRRTFAPIAFLLFFYVNLSFFELLRTLPRGSQKHGPQSSQRTSQKSEKFSELLRRFSGFVFELFFILTSSLDQKIVDFESKSFKKSMISRAMACQGERPRAASTRFVITIL